MTYMTAIDADPAEAKECILALAAILVATSTGNADSSMAKSYSQQSTNEILGRKD
jgi:hypothetical protein